MCVCVCVCVCVYVCVCVCARESVCVLNLCFLSLRISACRNSLFPEMCYSLVYIVMRYSQDHVSRVNACGLCHLQDYVLHFSACGRP